MLFCVVVMGAAWGDVVYPARTGRVIDQAGLLTSAARDRLTQLLAEHERKTSNQVVVLTVKSLQGLEIEAYALSLANKWGVGQADRDNGVLLVVAPNERQVRIEVGTGLEHLLTDRIAADIIDYRMLPVFRDGRYQAGIQEGVSGILSAIYGAYQLREPPRSDESVNGVMIAVLVVVGAVIIVWSNMSGGQLGDAGDRDRRRTSWRSDDDDWGRSSRSSSRSSFGGRSSGGGSFRGGGASGRW
jgi:uncharacterized protein